MTEINEIKDTYKDDFIFVECRGITVKALSKYLDRIDLFRTIYEQTGENKFELTDYSPEEFNEYLNYLRDNKEINYTIPDKIVSIYKYLNTDCLKMNEIENKIRDKDEIFNEIKRVINIKSSFDVKKELEITPFMSFGHYIDITPVEYAHFKDDIDKLIKDRKYCNPDCKYEAIVKPSGCKNKLHMILVCYNNTMYEKLDNHDCPCSKM